MPAHVAAFSLDGGANVELSGLSRGTAYHVPSILGDVCCDGLVNFDDLLVMLANWT